MQTESTWSPDSICIRSVTWPWLLNVANETHKSWYKIFGERSQLQHDRNEKQTPFRRTTRHFSCSNVRTSSLWEHPKTHQNAHQRLNVTSVQTPAVRNLRYSVMKKTLCPRHLLGALHHQCVCVCVCDSQVGEGSLPVLPRPGPPFPAG